MTKWFRFYSDAMRNPKVARLSDREFRLWMQVLAVASENEGRIPPADELKHVLNARLDHLLSGLERLISGGLIDRLERGYEPHNWGKFQYKSDTSTDRVAKHREKRNVPETPPDTDTEQRHKIEPLAQRPTAAAPPRENLLDRLLDANGIRGFRVERSPGLTNIAPIIAMVEGGLDLERDVLAAIRAKPNAEARTWGYFTGWIREFAQLRRFALSISSVPVPVEDWAGRLTVFKTDGTWINAWGPKPGEAGCRVPRELLEKAAA